MAPLGRLQEEGKPGRSDEEMVDKNTSVALSNVGILISLLLLFFFGVRVDEGGSRINTKGCRFVDR